MPRSAQASVWANELSTGALPPVCIKSGRPADSKLTFGFGEPPSCTAVLAAAAVSLVFTVIPGGRTVRGPLPLIRRWRQSFLFLRTAGIGLAAIGVLLLVAAGLPSPELRAEWVALAFGSLAASLVIGTVYGGLKPKGEVFKSADGELWVRIREVHPNFANAVAAMDQTDPRKLE